MDNELELEIQAMSANIRAQYCGLTYVSLKQITALNGLLNKGLVSKKRETRIAVVRLLVGPVIKDIVGVDITSTKCLTSPVCSYLIEQLKERYGWELSNHGAWLLSEAENAVSD